MRLGRMRGVRKRAIAVPLLAALFTIAAAGTAFGDSVSVRSTSEIATGESDIFTTAVVNDETVPVWEISKTDKLVLENLDLPYVNRRELSIGILYPQPDKKYVLELKEDGTKDYLEGAGSYLTIDTDLNAGEEYDLYNLLRIYGDMGGQTMDQCLFFMMFRYDKDGVDTVWTGDVYLKFVDAKTQAHRREAMENTLQPGLKEVPVWKSNETGWWLEYSDGSYLTNQWFQSLESGLWYYMGGDGYMLTDTQTPDGLYVNADGVWIQ